MDFLKGKESTILYSFDDAHCRTDLTNSFSGAEQRPDFGGRHISTDQLSDDIVFQQNAWDDVTWNDDQILKAEAVADEHASVALSSEDTEQRCEQLKLLAAAHWNRFYAVHSNRFFKERRWLFTEFPELIAPSDCSETYRIMELGCGNGATFFPLLKANDGRNAFVYGCDFSSAAIEIIKASSDYDLTRSLCFVLDISVQDVQFPESLQEGSLDCIILLFVLSALQPTCHLSTLRRLVKLLRPGGRLLLRDYGQYDLAQLRLKPERCLAKNWYARGDGTFVYFFQLEELRQLLKLAGLIEVRAYEDRRLQVNRGRRLKMYRVWIQCVFELASPPLLSHGATTTPGSNELIGDIASALPS